MNFKAIHDANKANAFLHRQSKRLLKNNDFKIEDLLNCYGNIDKAVKTDSFEIAEANAEAQLFLEKIKVNHYLKSAGFRKCTGNYGKVHYEPVFEKVTYFSKKEFVEKLPKNLKKEAITLFDKDVVNFDYSKVSISNYFQKTKVLFHKCDKKTIANAYKDEYKVTELLKENANTISDSNSQYWIFPHKAKKNDFMIVRKANHWGIVASCKWDIDVEDKNYSFGVAKLSDFTRI